jgi:energy-coupling factor transporter ATP-binding protein EcfA2
MIELADVAVTYDGAPAPTISGATFAIDEGEMVLVVGPTGSGKSTLLRCLNGLVPHFSGGTITGRVVIAGRDTRDHRPRDLADVVGFVGQDPMSSFVTETVEDEIAYGMEILGVDPTAMRRRVEETLDLLGLTAVRDRPLSQLSGGQQQRVAIAAVLAAGPRVLVLDEPTSALDPVGAEEVLAALHRLVHDVGLTVVLAEHRLERVIHYADQIILINDGRVSPLRTPADAMMHSPVHPPVVALGRSLRWSPLPLSVREARRAASGLRAQLGATSTLETPTQRNSHSAAPGDAGLAGQPSGHPRSSAAVVTGLTVNRGGQRALDEVDVTFTQGAVTAVMGRNGAGKSTLLLALAGILRPRVGRVRLGEVDPSELSPPARVARVGLVPQDPGILLYADSVAAECAAADADLSAPAGRTADLVREISGDLPGDLHPGDLSEGQRLSLALAIILAGGPDVLLLDEPTRGLDYAAKGHLVTVLRRLAAAGTTVILATHDVELVADVADRVVVLADGRVVADGPARAVIAGSPAFAPQVAKIMHPVPLLTVADVTAALEHAS